MTGLARRLVYDHLRKTRGIQTSRNAVQYNCSKIGSRLSRPMATNRDCMNLLYLSAAVNLITASLHTNTQESIHDTKRRAGQNKIRQLQKAFATHLHHTGRA